MILFLKGTSRHSSNQIRQRWGLVDSHHWAELGEMASTSVSWAISCGRSAFPGLGEARRHVFLVLPWESKDHSRKSRWKILWEILSSLVCVLCPPWSLWQRSKSVGQTTTGQRRDLSCPHTWGVYQGIQWEGKEEERCFSPMALSQSHLQRRHQLSP